MNDERENHPKNPAGKRLTDSVAANELFFCQPSESTAMLEG